MALNSSDNNGAGDSDNRSLVLDDSQESSAESKKSPLKRWLPLALIAVVMIVGFSQGWHKLLSINALVENRELLGQFVENNFILTLLGFSVLYILSVTLSLPGAVILTLAGGFLFGWFVGGIIIVISATIGATLLFIAAQSAFGAALREKAGPLVGKFAEGFEKDAFNYLLFIRLVPLFPFWLCNLAPAILGVKLRTYVLTTFLGIIPGTFAFALTGSGLNSIIDSYRETNPDCAGNADCAADISLSLFFTPEILYAFAALGVVALIPVLLKRLRKS